MFVATAALWVLYLPGYFVSRALVPEARGVERHGFALVSGFSVVPLAVFLIAVAASLPVDAPLLWLVATTVNLGGLAAMVHWRVYGDLQVGWRDSLAVVLAVACTGLVLLFGVRSLDGGDVFSTVHHCLYVIVMHTIVNDPSVGVPLYDAMGDGFVHYLVHHPTTEFNGLAPLVFEQRLGNAAILAPAVALFGSAGWYLGAVHATVITGVCAYLAARSAGVRGPAAVVAAVLFAFGMRTFCGYFINENNFAVALVAFLLWTALRSEHGRGLVVLVGIVSGHLIGVRYTSSLFWPAIALAVLWRPGTAGERARQFALGAAFALAAVAPWLYINSIMLGTPFADPKIFREYCSRIVQNELWGWRFDFRALNWPFTDAVVRTAWNPFPTFLWLPLWTALCYGQVAVATALYGFGRLLKDVRQRRTTWLLVAFAVPHCAVMMLLESLDWEQLSYAAPGLVPFAVVLALGLDALWVPGAWRRPALVIAGLLVLVAGTSRLLRSTSWPVDARQLVLEDGTVLPTPAPDPGVLAVGEMLTAFAPLPRLPVLRSSFASVTWRSLAHVLGPPAVPTTPTPDGPPLPVYASGEVAAMAGYDSRVARNYAFHLAGGPERRPSDGVRSSLGLHMVSLRLAASEVAVKVLRTENHYDVDVTVINATPEVADFTFWLRPWFPPVRSVSVRLDGRTLADARTVTYGGKNADGEERFIVTNYPSDVLDTVAIPFEVDPNGEPARCGMFLFLQGVDVTHIETLVLAGGHDQSWRGELHGTLRVPRGLRSDRVVLHADPYCSDHVPQYGDRYALVDGPFLPERPLRFVLNRMW